MNLEKYKLNSEPELLKFIESIKTHKAAINYFHEVKYINGNKMETFSGNNNTLKIYTSKN